MAHNGFAITYSNQASWSSIFKDSWEGSLFNDYFPQSCYINMSKMDVQYVEGTILHGSFGYLNMFLQTETVLVARWVGFPLIVDRRHGICSKYYMLPTIYWLQPWCITCDIDFLKISIHGSSVLIIPRSKNCGTHSLYMLGSALYLDTSWMPGVNAWARICVL